jgi:CheY-like chemotaxis protein
MAASPPGQGLLLILVIDPDPATHGFLRQNLPEASVKIGRAKSAKEGFETTKRVRPQIVFLSVDMANGMATCNRIKREAELKGTLVALVASDWDPKMKALHQNLPTAADHYLDGPIGPGVLAWPIFQAYAAGVQQAGLPPQAPPPQAEVPPPQVQAPPTQPQAPPPQSQAPPPQAQAPPAQAQTPPPQAPPAQAQAPRPQQMPPPDSGGQAAMAQLQQEVGQLKQQVGQRDRHIASLQTDRKSVV